MIPKKGTWIMIRGRIIPVEIPIDPLSFWYAIPTGKLFWTGELENRMAVIEQIPYGLKEIYGRRFEEDQCKRLIADYFSGAKSYEVDAHKNKLKNLEEAGEIYEEMIEQQVRIKTPFGDVCIQPFEYTTPKEAFQSAMEESKDGHALIRYLSESKTLKGKIADQVFYLKSRGIPHREALALCFQNVATQNLFYVEMHPEYQMTFTRDWELYWSRKMSYCKKHERLDLLDYGETWNYSQEKICA